MTTTRTRVQAAALTGLTTAAYYAVPDVTTSRAARGWLRAACLVAGGAVNAWASRDDLAEARAGWQDTLAHLRAAREGDRAAAAHDDPHGSPQDDATAVPDVDASDPQDARTDLDDAPTDPDAPAAPASRLPAPVRTGVAVAVGAAALAGSVALTVAGERWLYRRAEARAAAGVRLAHTRQGLVLGALGALLLALPEQRGDDATDGHDQR